MHKDVTRAPSTRSGATLGVAFRRRQLQQLARMLQDKAPELEATIVKDLGNRFEQEVVEQCRSLRPATVPGTPYADALQQAMLYMPRVTIQGGTPQILRNAMARALGLR